MDTPLRLCVEVPICAFRPYTSREYQDTYPVPTPSAVYGMLLSLVGVTREQKARHSGIAMALAVEQQPQRTKVFRKLRRGEDLEDLRPDYQDLLVDVIVWIWLRSGEDTAVPDLRTCVIRSLEKPAAVTRFGGLSLGESSYLVDSISTKREPPDEPVFLKPNPEGFYSLPVWVDHQTNKPHLQRFELERMPIEKGLETCWMTISPR